MARLYRLFGINKLIALFVLGLGCGSFLAWHFKLSPVFIQPMEKMVIERVTTTTTHNTTSTSSLSRNTSKPKSSVNVKKDEAVERMTTTATHKTTSTSSLSRSTSKPKSSMNVKKDEPLQVIAFPSWVTSDPHDETFIRRVYLYSAFVALHGGPANGVSVHLVGHQEGAIRLPLKCCAALPGGRISEGGPAEPDFPHTDVRPSPGSKDLNNIGMVYRCHFPTLTAEQVDAGHVTLTPSEAACPVKNATSPDTFVEVQVPEQKPDGLAICGKVAYGMKLDARKLVEWFETQSLLGVDKILIYDLNNTDLMHRVFRHYQDTGLLDLLPYKLPGRKWGRGMIPSGPGIQRIITDDQTMPLWDCRLRLAGYEFVMGIDMDEIIMPRNVKSLKPFFKEEFDKRPTAAALFFNVQFFVSDWGPVDPAAPLLFLQYLNSTAPRWECYKYVYKPPRVHQVQIHVVHSYHGYQGMVRLPSSAATILHFRVCPHVWSSCNPPRITDRTMLRFKDELIPRVKATNKLVGL